MFEVTPTLHDVGSAYNLVVDGVIVPSKDEVEIRDLSCQLLVVGDSHVGQGNHNVALVDVSQFPHLVLRVFHEVDILQLSLIVLSQ